MTTTVAGTTPRTRRTDSPAPAVAALVRPDRRAVAAATAVVGTLALSLPAVALLDHTEGTATVDVVASFLLIGGLELLAARALWRLTRGHSHPAAYAALLARVGYALLVVVGALVLLVHGAQGLGDFRNHWLSALGVLGLHLVAAGVALRRCPSVGRAGPLLVAGCGAAGLAAALAPLGGVSLTTALVPVLAGEVVLTGVLARAALGRPVG